MGPVARVTIFGGLRFTDGSGRELVLSDRRRSVLAALAVADGPVARQELVSAVGIGRSTLRPLLSRLASDDLGLDSPVHQQIDVRRGLIALDRSLVSSDVDDLRRLLAGRVEVAELRAMIELGVLNPPADLDLIAGQTLTITLTEKLRSLRVAAARAIARHELTTGGAGPSLLDTVPRPDPALPELWLAKLDRQARSEGKAAARRSLAAVENELGPLDGWYTTGPGPANPDSVNPDSVNPDSGNAGSAGADTASVDAADAAKVIIETAQDASTSMEPRPSVDDQRRAGLILDGLASADVRVLSMYDPTADAASVAALSRPLRSRLPATFGTWCASGIGAVEALAQLIQPIVADRIRQLDDRPSARMLKTLIAIAEGQPLEPDSTSRWFGRDVGALLQQRSGRDSPLIVIGRAAARSDDLDRLLADLLRLDSGLRVVILHTDPLDSADPSTGDDSQLPFDGIEMATVAAVVAEERGPVGALPGSALPGSALPIEPATSAKHDEFHPVADDELQRMMTVVELAVSGHAEVHRSLAVHLLELVGSPIEPSQVIDAVIASRRTGYPALSSGPSVPGGELQWLTAEAIRWLTAGGLKSSKDVSILGDLTAKAAPEGLPVGLSIGLLPLAAVAVSHGDLDRGRALLDVAVETAETTKGEVLALGQRGDCHRDRGDWVAALADYRSAVTLLTDEDRTGPAIADLVLRMARLTWDPAVGQEVDALLRGCLDQLDPGESIWRARLELCLAGGSFQDGSAGLARLDGDEILAALETVRTALDPGVRAWGLIHARKAMLGVASSEQSARWAQEIVDNGQLDIAALAHGHQALFVDHVRRGDWSAARRALLRITQLARTPVSAEQKFSALVSANCLALASADIEGAAAGLASAQEFGPQLGGSTFDQVTLGQSVWLARLRGDRQELEGLATAAAGLADSQPGGEIWMAGAALLAVDVGRYDEAADRVVDFARRVGGFDDLRAGAHRLGVLGIAAIVAGHVAAFGSRSPFTDVDLKEIDAGLATTDCAVVLIGWPTVILGPVDRFRGLIAAVLGRQADTDSAFARARGLDADLSAMGEQADRLERIAGLLLARQGD